MSRGNRRSNTTFEIKNNLFFPAFFVYFFVWPLYLSFEDWNYLFRISWKIICPFEFLLEFEQNVVQQSIGKRRLKNQFFFKKNNKPTCQINHFNFGKTFIWATQKREKIFHDSRTIHQKFIIQSLYTSTNNHQNILENESTLIGTLFGMTCNILEYKSSESLALK